MIKTDWLAFAQRLSALAQNGLAYVQSEYDRERYEEIYAISLQMFASLSELPTEAIIKILPSEAAYQTPKVDIRAVVLNEQNQLLMVQEKLDNSRWTLPGGWADVGYTPFEVAQKEVLEETGLEVEVVRLLAVFDKKMHEHPPQPWYVYKFFILCRPTGGELNTNTIETTGAYWVDQQELASLELSTDRVTLGQLRKVLVLAADANSQAVCD